MLEERHHSVTAAEPEEQRKLMKTILQETTGEVDKEIQKLLEKKRSCHNCLLAKPDDQAAKALTHVFFLYSTRLPAVHSRISLGPCRMIGGQDLPGGHNGMLIWVTCAPSMRH